MSRALPVSPTNCAAPPSPPSSSSSSSSTSASSLPSPPLLTPKDVTLAVQEEIQNLQAEDEMTIMKAAASLVMFSALPQAEPYLVTSVPKLLLLLLVGDYSLHVQRNACVALTAIMNASAMLYHAVAETPDLLKGLLRCLDPSIDDVGLQINALVALSALAQQELGLALIQDAGAEDILLSLLADTVNAKLEEDLVDTLCTIAAHGRMMPVLVQKGAVPKLAQHLASDSPEVCVRVLLALGMLCGSSTEGQRELALADGAVNSLLKLMMSNDHDVKSISRDLFSTLASNQENRLVVQQMMSQTSECHFIPFPFVSNNYWSESLFVQSNPSL